MLKLLGIAGVMALGLSGAAQAGPAIVGVSEQHPQFMQSGLFKKTKIKQVRRIVAWDAVWRADERHRVETWIAMARLQRLEVMVSFGPSRSKDRTLPSPKRYGRAVSRFMERHPWIRNYSAWNEPNLGRTRDRPRLIARYWQQLKARCAQCKLIGAEVADSPNMERWIKGFKSAAREQPDIWGLHNYNDVNKLSRQNTERFLEMTQGRVWLSETGGIVRKKDRSKQRFRGGERHQVKATRYLLDQLAPMSERIDRVYLYHWNQEASPDTWDSGLVRKDGTARPAYQAVASRVDKEGRLDNQDTPDPQLESKPAEAADQR